jgi:hypothetical protein
MNRMKWLRRRKMVAVNNLMGYVAAAAGSWKLEAALM